MNININDFLNHPNVFSKEWEDLILFSYTRGCQYDGLWDSITTAARGIIFNKKTGDLVFRSMEKFWNLSEVNETKTENLPDLPFTVTTKVDGVLGLMFQYEGLTYVSTRGSFTSTYAYWATDWVRKNVHLDKINPAYSYHFEIIYKGSRIVIDYGDKEHLVLICVIETETGRELSHAELVQEAEQLGVEPVGAIQANSVDELYQIAKTLDASNEGFVVTFSNGLKVKIKGNEYCRLHKAIMHMTPLSYWEQWVHDSSEIPLGVPKEFLVQIPEEYREESDTIAKAVNESHINAYLNAVKLYKEIRDKLGAQFTKKVFAEEVFKNYKKHSGYIFGVHSSIESGNWSGFWWGVHKSVRPTNNIIPNIDYKILSRLERASEEC